MSWLGLVTTTTGPPEGIVRRIRSSATPYVIDDQQPPATCLHRRTTSDSLRPGPPTRPSRPLTISLPSLIIRAAAAALGSTDLWSQINLLGFCTIYRATHGDFTIEGFNSLVWTETTTLSNSHRDYLQSTRLYMDFIKQMALPDPQVYIPFTL